MLLRTNMKQSKQHEPLYISSRILQLHYMFRANLDHHKVYQHKKDM